MYMKLFVWEDALSAYTAGIMFAFANDLDEAKKLISEKYSWSQSVQDELAHKPTVYTTAIGFVAFGGG